MPDPPRVGLLTRYVFENPYPLGLVLLALGGGVLWTVLRTGRRQRVSLGLALLAAGAAVLGTGKLVATAGERARGVVLALVDAAVAADVTGAIAIFSADATLAFGSPTNPGLSFDAIRRRVEQLDGKYRIESNQITSLKAYTESSDRATVHLACRTELLRGYGMAPTQWVVQVERQDDGTWKVTRVTWVSIAGRSPMPDLGL